MRGLQLGPNGVSLRTDLSKPRPGPGEALIRVTRMGVCSTDLELVKGYAGFSGILGHEFVGVVEDSARGANSAFEVGQRVVGTINLACGECPVCVGSGPENGPEHCPHRTVLGIIGKDGAFADYVTLPEANLLPVPDSVEDDRAVFTEPLAAALRIREQIAVRPTARMAVVGPGRLGLLIAQVLALGGGRPLVLGRREESLVLPDALGLDTGLATEAEGDSFDLVVEATGNEEGLAESLRLVRPQGTLVLKSTFEGKASVDLTKLVVGEVRVVGSRCGPFAPALRLLEQDAVNVLALIDGRYPLDRAEEALAHAARPGIRKILLDP